MFADLGFAGLFVIANSSAGLFATTSFTNLSAFLDVGTSSLALSLANLSFLAFSFIFAFFLACGSLSADSTALGGTLGVSTTVSELLARFLTLSDSSALSSATMLALSLVSALSQSLAGILASLDLLALSGTSSLAVLEFSALLQIIALGCTLGDLSAPS